ncbi:hypothetical protein [Geodermatophilus sp. CPCC 205761]|uniref:hypothetical protein n=1 Tax=Geodermatophilus sp. CPCC 205761 TaxID=2936597 RepID=UPI003EEC355D
MDAYDRKARLYPAAVVIFPLTLLGLLLFSLPDWWKGLATFAAAGGLHVPVMHLVRDRGAGKQDALWEGWGGPPTTLLLRWTGKTNVIQQKQRHTAVASATGLSLPSPEEETANPADADAVYESAVDLLRAKTRGEVFSLVQAENANYGFRRNLYGCRAFGIAVALIIAIAEGVLAILGIRHVVEVSPALMFVAAGTSLLWLAGWIFTVTPAFVKRDADRYALALVLAAATVEKG